MKNTIIFLLTSATLLFAQSKIEMLRDHISDVNIGFLESKLPDEKKLQSIESSLAAIEKTDSYNVVEVLNELNNYNSILNSENNVDSLKKAFRTVNNKFNASTYKYFYDKIIKSRGKKIIIFSTSMSCECTLEQCYKQESEVQEFCRDNNYEYVVIDTWEDSELQKKHNVGFIPTVILLNSTNNEQKRFVREEKLSNKLNDE